MLEFKVKCDWCGDFHEWQQPTVGKNIHAIDYVTIESKLINNNWGYTTDSGHHICYYCAENQREQ